jgi:hypothetical protein
MSQSQAYEDDGNASGSSPVQPSRELVVSTNELKGFGPLEQTSAISLPLSNKALKAAEKAVVEIEHDFDSLLEATQQTMGETWRGFFVGLEGSPDDTGDTDE